MRNRVTCIRTHSTLFVDGWGNTGDVFPGSKSFLGLLMLRVSEGVEVTAPGKKAFLVPWGNIKSVDLAETNYKAPEENKVSQAV